MFEQLKRLLRDTPHGTPEADRRLAAAVLMIEVARADYDHHPAELSVLREVLTREFNVPPETLEPLLAEASQRQQQAVSLYDFVQTLNRTMGPDDKRSLMRLLWSVAYADGRIDPLEEHRLRHLANLLYVPHSDFIRTKLDVAGDR